jgi:hypothetical protein
MPKLLKFPPRQRTKSDRTGERGGVGFRNEMNNLALFKTPPKPLIPFSFYVHCFICRPSDSTVSEDAGIDDFVTLTVERSKPLG